MHLPKRHRDKAALAATVMGVVLICVALTGLLGGDDAPASGDKFAGSQGADQFGADAGQTDDSGVSAGTSNKLNQLTGTNGADVFATSTGSDNTVHKVVIKFVSDGGMYAGWRYRTKGGEGVKVAAYTLTVTKNVRGGLPVAQAAVQTLSTATYSKCTVYVDGVAVDTQTAKGAHHVTVCLG